MSRHSKLTRTGRRVPAPSGRQLRENLTAADTQALADEWMNYHLNIRLIHNNSLASSPSATIGVPSAFLSRRQCRDNSLGSLQLLPVEGD